MKIPQVADEERRLTPLQMEIVRLIANGSNYQQISESTGLRVTQVKSRIETLLANLKAKNKAHLVAQVFREGLASPDMVNVKGDK